jgi:hypothetical protein
MVRSHRIGLVAGVAVLALLAGPGRVRADVIFGLSQSGNQFVVFDTVNPGVILQTTPVTGITGTLVGFDFRPADGALVGLTQSGAGGFLYQINPFTGVATQINTIPTLSGSAFGMDFNPVPNALRIVSNTGQNLRITTGGAGGVNTDTALNPGTPSIVAAAYSNNVPGGVNGQTTLYVIDNVTGRLLTQGSIDFPPGTSPNTGILFDVGSLGIGANLTPEIGFDISSAGAAFVSIGNSLFLINVGTGALSPVGTVGGPPLRDIAVAPNQVAQVFVPEPTTLAVFGGLTGLALVGRRRRLARTNRG